MDWFSSLCWLHACLSYISCVFLCRAWFEELRKKRMEELRQALKQSENSIGWVTSLSFQDAYVCKVVRKSKPSSQLVFRRIGISARLSMLLFEIRRRWHFIDKWNFDLKCMSFKTLSRKFGPRVSGQCCELAVLGVLKPLPMCLCWYLLNVAVTGHWNQSLSLSKLIKE